MYMCIGVFWLVFDLILYHFSPSEENLPRFKGSYAKLPNASTILAIYYST